MWSEQIVQETERPKTGDVSAGIKAFNCPEVNAGVVDLAFARA